MKLLLIMIAAFAAPVFSQISLERGPTLNGIRLGATHGNVIAKFGKPMREKTYKIDECIGDRTRRVDYPGLVFELAEYNGTFKVYGFELSSPKYSASGIKIGARVAEVLKRFGTRGRTLERSRGQEVWFYDMHAHAPGLTNFYFRRGRLVKITSSYTMC